MKTPRVEPPTDTAGDSPYITVAQLAARWHLPIKTIYNMRCDGKLPDAIRRGRNVLFPLAQIEAQELADFAASRAESAEREHQMRAPEAAAA